MRFRWSHSAAGYITTLWLLAMAPLSAQADSTSTALEPLQPKLDARAAESSKRMPEETSKLFSREIDNLRASGILDRALNVGDTAVDFTLPNATGDSVTLSTLLKNGPVVIVWYRGGWCPYCNMTLSAWHDAYPYIDAAGAQLVAISPEVPDKSLTTKEKHELAFEVLSDSNNHVARQYHIVFKLSDPLMESYNHFFSLSEYNGNDHNELPLPATYVIDTNRVIRYAFLNADYKKRAEPADVLDVLSKL